MFNAYLFRHGSIGQADHWVAGSEDPLGSDVGENVALRQVSLAAVEHHTSVAQIVQPVFFHCVRFIDLQGFIRHYL